MKTTKEIGQLVQKLLQVHTKASFGASPATSQLRWARLDVTGLAPVLVKEVAVEVMKGNPLTRGRHTHTHTHTHFWALESQHFSQSSWIHHLKTLVTDNFLVGDTVMLAHQMRYKL